VYVPTLRSDDEKVVEVYASIEELMKHTKSHDNVIANPIVGEAKLRR